MKKFIDLFCGAGGLSCGLEQAGFLPVLANEIDPIYAATYMANNPSVTMINNNIKGVNSQLLESILAEYGEIDLIAGGPPCQGYSINAPKRSIDDPRNHLFKEYLRIVDILRPKAILIENVTGIVSFESGYVIEMIYRELEKLNYKVNHKILCASQYGIPQMRNRTFFIGIKDYRKRIEFPYPTHNSEIKKNFTNSKKLCFDTAPLLSIGLKSQVNVGEALSDLPEIDDNDRRGEYIYAKAPQNSFQEYLRKDSSFITSHYCAKLSEINRRRLKFIPQGGSWRDIPFDLLPAGLKKARRSDHTKRYGRLNPDSLCSTILTKCDPHWGCFFHPTQERVISVREAARIQSFPDRIKFMGSITQQYQQVGNAVPPLLGKVLGDRISSILEGEDGYCPAKK